MFWKPYRTISIQQLNSTVAIKIFNHHTRSSTQKLHSSSTQTQHKVLPYLISRIVFIELQRLHTNLYQHSKFAMLGVELHKGPRPKR